MAHEFGSVERDQLFLMPPDVRSWLPPDHEVWFVIEVVDQLDLSALEATYRLGGAGRAPVSPRMLLALLVWAYSRGVTSSRRIERACHEDVAFRVICGNEAPDHTTIARFRQRHEAVAADLFVQVLGLCAAAGLVHTGVMAVDGTKISANAAADANRDIDRLRGQVQGWFDAAAEADAADDDEFGEGTGLGMPAELVDAERRRARIRELLDELGDDAAGRVNVTDPDSRIMRSASGGHLQGYNAQVVCAPGQIVVAAAVTNHASDVAELHPMIDLVEANLTGAGIDEAPGTVLADAGYLSADNVEEAVARGRDVLIATAKRRDLPIDGSGHDPAAEAAERAAFDTDQARVAGEIRAEQQRRAVIFEHIDRTGGDVRDHLDALGVSRAVAHHGLRQWRQGGTEAISVHKVKWRIPRPKGRSRGQAARDAMNDRFADPASRQLYAKRAHLVETYFARNKHLRGFRGFTRRGLDAVNAEWALLATVHNVGQLRHAT